MLTIDWGTTYRIHVPQSYLEFVSTDIYNLDTEQFRRDLLLLEHSVEGIVEPKTHEHNTTYTISDVEYARAIQILPPYSVEFEEGQYTVNLIGSNNNIGDVKAGILVRNQVQVIPGNTAGLVVSEGGDGGTTIIRGDSCCTTFVHSNPIESYVVANATNTDVSLRGHLSVNQKPLQRTVTSTSRLTVNAS